MRIDGEVRKFDPAEDAFRAFSYQNWPWMELKGLKNFSKFLFFFLEVSRNEGEKIYPDQRQNLYPRFASMTRTLEPSILYEI